MKLHNEIETITKISLWLVDKARRKRLERTPSVSSGKTKINYTMGELLMKIFAITLFATFFANVMSVAFLFVMSNLYKNEFRGWVEYFFDNYHRNRGIIPRAQYEKMSPKEQMDYTIERVFRD